MTVSPLKARHGPARFLILMIVLCATQTGCALLGGDDSPPPAQYTLGSATTSTPNRQPAAPSTGDTLDLRPVSVPGWLDSQRMLYRLDYADDAAQLSAYTESRWATTPAQLVDERLSDALSASHMFNAVLANMPGRANLALQITLDDFSQHFASTTQSQGRVAATATLMRTDTGAVIAQRHFVTTADAPTANAAGGVTALASADRQLNGEIRDWLAKTLADCTSACPSRPN